MGYICKDCGNQDRFTGWQKETSWNTQQVYLDGEGEIVDYGDSDTDNSEVTDGPDEITCSECDSEDVVWRDEEEEIEEILKEIQERKKAETTIQNWKQRIK